MKIRKRMSCSPQRKSRIFWLILRRESRPFLWIAPQVPRSDPSTAIFNSPQSHKDHKARYNRAGNSKLQDEKEGTMSWKLVRILLVEDNPDTQFVVKIVL